MSDFNTLLVSIESQIATITVNRPKALNALNKQVFDELETCFTTYLPDQDVMGVIIRGAGEKAFVAGADITEFATLDQQEGQALSSKGQRIFSLIEHFHRPVIAVVQGFALGGGCELAMACHMRIAETNAKFGLPELKLGLIPGYGGTQRLKALVGQAKAIELMLSSDMIGGEEAVRLGLANHLVEQGEGMNKAIEILSKIAKRGPLAIAAALKAVMKANSLSDKAFAYEAELFGEVMASADAKEGAKAFLEKRKANFQGK